MNVKCEHFWKKWLWHITYYPHIHLEECSCQNQNHRNNCHILGLCFAIDSTKDIPLRDGYFLFYYFMMFKFCTFTNSMTYSANRTILSLLLSLFPFYICWWIKSLLFLPPHLSASFLISYLLFYIFCYLPIPGRIILFWIISSLSFSFNSSFRLTIVILFNPFTWSNH
jgi:hypothetical protein